MRLTSFFGQPIRAQLQANVARHWPLHVPIIMSVPPPWRAAHLAAGRLRLAARGPATSRVGRGPGAWRATRSRAPAHPRPGRQTPGVSSRAVQLGETHTHTRHDNLRATSIHKHNKLARPGAKVCAPAIYGPRAPSRTAQEDLPGRRMRSGRAGGITTSWNAKNALEDA